MYLLKRDESETAGIESEPLSCIFESPEQTSTLQIAAIFIVLVASLLGVIVPTIFKKKVSIIINTRLFYH